MADRWKLPFFTFPFSQLFLCQVRQTFLPPPLQLMVMCSLRHRAHLSLDPPSSVSGWYTSCGSSDRSHVRECCCFPTLDGTLHRGTCQSSAADLDRHTCWGILRWRQGRQHRGPLRAHLHGTHMIGPPASWWKAVGWEQSPDEHQTSVSVSVSVSWTASIRP